MIGTTGVMPDFDPFQTAVLLQAFRDTTGEKRAELIAASLQQMSSGLRGINAIVACVDVDPKQLEAGLTAALAANPANLTAGRSLIWLLIRAGRMDEADLSLRTLITHWPDHRELYAERVRCQIINNDPAAAETLQRAGSRLSPVTRQAYGLQVAAQHDAEPPRDQVAAFAASLHAAFFDMMNAPDTSDSLSPAQRHELWEVMERVLGARRIAIVGNAPTLTGSGAGEEIDGHDLVVRCNFAEITSFYGDVGRRADIVVFNESLRGQLGRLRQRSPAYADVSALGLHPEPDFGLPCGEAASETRAAATLPPATRRFLSGLCYPRSTTGVMAINVLGLICNKEISLYGFDFFSDTCRPHYFGHQVGAYLGHEIQYERWYTTRFLPRYLKNRLRFHMPRSA